MALPLGDRIKRQGGADAGGPKQEAAPEEPLCVHKDSGPNGVEVCATRGEGGAHGESRNRHWYPIPRAGAVGGKANLSAWARGQG